VSERVLHPRNSARRRHARTGWVAPLRRIPSRFRPEDRAGCRHHVHSRPDSSVGQIRTASQTGDRGMFLPWWGGADWRRCRNKGEWCCRTGRTTSSSGAITNGLSFGPTQTRDVNARDRRSGMLWEGRYASSPIETEAQWLACGRYVELNPVRARMVKRPEPYGWSSSRARAGLSAWTWPDRDPYAFTSPPHMTSQADFVAA
jgi:hypothetical protein